jgi:hypothetical protein
MASRNQRQATGRILTPNRRALEEKYRLWTGLEQFANLDDSPEKYQTYAEKYGSFWPIDIQDGSGASLKWRPKFQKLMLVFRDYLRQVWRSEPNALKNESLGILLGLEREYLGVALEAGSAAVCRERGQPVAREVRVPNNDLIEACRCVRRAYPNAIIASSPTVAPYWPTGNFVYIPQNDFQRAVYSLFRESWRARTCRTCTAYFIAQKPAQLYCATKCAGAAKQQRDLEYWKDTGAKKRHARIEKSREKRGVR